MNRLVTPYLSSSGVCDLLIQADVQIVSGLIGEEEADGNGVAGGGVADVDLQFSLEHTQLPQTTAVPHDHGTDGLFYLQEPHEQNIQIYTARFMSLLCFRETNLRGVHDNRGHKVKEDVVAVGTSGCVTESHLQLIHRLKQQPLSLILQVFE